MTNIEVGHFNHRYLPVATHHGVIESVYQICILFMGFLSSVFGSITRPQDFTEQNIEGQTQVVHKRATSTNLESNHPRFDSGYEDEIEIKQTLINVTKMDTRETNCQT